MLNCVCWGEVGAQCAIYSFYFLHFVPRLRETLASLEGHLQICPMSVSLVKQSIFSGVCVTFAGCHILGTAPSCPPKGAGVGEQALSRRVVQAAVSGPCANLQIIASSGREVVEVGEACL